MTSQSSHQHIPYCRETQHAFQNQIRRIKRKYFGEKNTVRPWNTLEQLGLPEKRLQSSDICLKAKESLTFDTLKLSELFINFYSNLANYLVKKLTATAKKFGLGSV